MKRTLTKHMIAAVSAAMLTMSASGSVMAATAQTTRQPAGIEQSAPSENTDNAGGQNQQQMPPKGAPMGEKPDGEMPTGEKPDGEMPTGEKPDGEMPTGEKPDGEMPTGEKPDGEMPTGEKPDGEMPEGEKPADLPEQVKPEENGTQNTAEAAAPANDSAQTAQKEVDKETLNLFQKFLQWVKGLAGKN